ncbi:MAG TPA: LysR family transcriptional regulator [Actinoplanes sp.]|nr:LysR family transcriptional regulator [Actinoplanes sp.]
MLNNGRMETRRLRILLELSRLGSMRAVADEMGITTSTVSQQVAALAREAGAALIEPDGRRVRLTPAGRRLAEHSVTILAAIEAARLDLDPGAEPAGTVRVSGFATAVRRSLLPIVADLRERDSKVRVAIHEHEPFEQFALLAADDIDLALTYDYNLAPATFDATLVARPLWSAPWALGVPAELPRRLRRTAKDEEPLRRLGRTATGGKITDFGGHDWIVNSRNTADEHVLRTLASIAGITPNVVHRADSLNLVQDLIAAGLGVGMLPADQPVRAGVRLVPLSDPPVLLRAYAVTRRGRAGWPPLALVLRLLDTGAR